MSSFLNVSTYRFARLDALPALRERLLRISHAGKLKGTILLSAEGINLFVAGERAAVEGLLHEIRSVPGLEDLVAKESESGHQPFNRMLVKIKKEIIAFGVPGVDPARRPTKKLSAQRLKQWLDEGRPLTLLDTRNNYEVRMGTFRGAQVIGTRTFREFPKAVAALPAHLKEQPIVMFCTGGIRCEKAGPYLEQVGFKDVHQLDGGILKYFEECGGAHYDGECFVFDRRVGVDPSLQETGSALCFNCQMPVKAAEQLHPHYVPDRSCMQCWTGEKCIDKQADRRRPVVVGGGSAR